MSEGERRNSASFGSGPRDWLLKRRVSSTGHNSTNTFTLVTCYRKNTESLYFPF